MSNTPWTFDEALARCQRTSMAQQQAEKFMRECATTSAHAEESYRMALAKEIVRQHAEEGVAWTVAPDLARGDKTVARLRRERDIAEGVREAAVQAAWRAAADRKDAQRFADFSLRRQLMEGGGEDDNRLAWTQRSVA